MVWKTPWSGTGYVLREPDLGGATCKYLMYEKDAPKKNMNIPKCTIMRNMMYFTPIYE
jgi:hypothetical protein